jgi:hypothetical protein
LFVGGSGGVKLGVGPWGGMDGSHVRVDIDGGLALVPASRRGGVPERLKGADCKSAGVRLRWFESNPLHQRNGKRLM